MSKTRILLVDDDVLMCDTLSDVLEIEGYEVVIAHDGPQAVELMRTGHFDSVLMDIRMPEMNGIEAYKAMKKERPDTKILLMTAYFSDPAVVKAQKESRVKIFFKPLDLADVMRLLQDEKKPRTTV